MDKALEIELDAYVIKMKSSKAGQIIPVSNELFKYITSGLATSKDCMAAQPSNTGNILEQAQALVYGDRNKAYGKPKDNFDNIASFWNAYIAIKMKQIHPAINVSQVNILNSIDIAVLNILQKIARLATNQTHRDSIVDIAGYAATIERIVDNK